MPSCTRRGSARSARGAPHGTALAALLLVGLSPTARSAAAPPTPAAELDAVAARHGVRLPAAARQLLLVVVPRWTSTHGTLRRLDRGPTGWRPVGSSVAVRVGAAGLGRGRGLHDTIVGALAVGPVKREGDRRSPAGLFALGTAFGSTSRPPHAPAPWPYRRTDPRDRFVDDPRSPRYNTWQRAPLTGDPPWRSAEELSQYRLAVVIQHNDDPVQPGAGSAVFLHSATSLARPSVGCTVLHERELLELLRWLAPRARPLLLQLPASRE